MGTLTSSATPASARRGLATIAFLKAQFDAGKDHLEMFQPFIVDAIRNYEVDDIEVPGIQTAVRTSTGLRIPAEIVKTLLSRAKKKGLLIRHGGRFIRKSTGSGDPALAVRIRELSVAQASLASALRQFAAGRGGVLSSDDDALAALTRFLDANHIGVVLGQRINTDASRDVARMDHIVAAFVASVIENAGPHRPALEGIVKGLIVQNALLLRDVPMAGRHLQGLRVFVDTGVLLRALGYGGETEQQAACEALKLIGAVGARLYAFERTVNEVEGILNVYEKNLGSSSGVKRLRPSSVTRHFLGIRATPADIRQEVLLLKKNLERLGISIRKFPEHIPEFTEDEPELARALQDPTRDEDTFDSRVWHDVQAIAAVLTLRAGAYPKRMATAGYVFASGSVRTVENALRWYRVNHPEGIEPLVHFRSVTNAAWFLRPANASDVPMHELVATCAGILQPSPEVWARFVRGLEALVKSGELTDDESIAALANGFTHIEPGELEFETDDEADTVREIVERVREEDQARFKTELAAERAKSTASERAASDALAREDSIRSRTTDLAEKVAAIAAGVIFSMISLVLLFGAILTLPVEWTDWTKSDVIMNLVCWACIAAFTIVSLLGFFTRRFHVLNVYDHLRSLLANRLKKVLLTEK